MIKYIKETIGLSEYSESDILNILGIFLVNDFSINAKVDNLISRDNHGIRGLY